MSYSFLDLAAEVLQRAPDALTYQQVWQRGVDEGLAEPKRDQGVKTAVHPGEIGQQELDRGEGQEPDLAVVGMAPL